MRCKFCEQPLPDVKTGRRPREYCNDAHRQAYYRRTHPPSRPVSDATLVKALAEATATIKDLEQQLATVRADLLISLEQKRELEKHILTLHNRLDLERRFYENTAYSFKAWLKQRPATEFRQRFLSDLRMMPRDTSAHYEYKLKRWKYSEEGMREFTDLWKLILLDRAK